MSALEEHLLGAYDEPKGDDARQAFQVTDDRQADWAFRKLARVLDELHRIDEEARTEVDRVHAWAEQARSPLTSDAEFFENLLIGYRLRLEQDDPEMGKTYKLAAGSISRRKAPDRVDLVNEDAFVEWAVANAPDAVTVRPKVSALKGKGTFKANLPEGATAGVVVHEATGEVVPGVAWLVGQDRYHVSPAGEL